ncbi:MAG: hypothetical protein IT462_07465 [Planctomycetes bacterium]|nr:hypothetical protein [Planctomycetota bacterium]
MGVFSRTMLMLTIAWLAAVNVAFIYLNANPEPDWRSKFISERNIRRAIAYRYTDIKGGRVPESGHEFKSESANSPIAAESIGGAPYGLPDESGSGGDTNGLPGTLIKESQSQIAMARQDGADAKTHHDNDVTAISNAINTLETNIAEFNRDRRKQVEKMSAVRDRARLFGAEMSAFRYIIASFQQKVFNLDYEIQRVIVERDALKAEFAQVQNDIGRIKMQQVDLENAYYELSRGYEQNVKVIAMYEQLDPNIRRLADQTGRGWLFGRVRSVGDDPRTGVVTISIGSQDGVEENQVFTIHRGGQFIGRMLVEEVSDNFATGRLLQEFRGKVTVIENDSVKAAENFGGATIPNSGKRN